MPRKQDRDFTQAFQAAGILDALAGPLVSDQIQLTYVMGDLSELLNIVRFPRRYGTFTSAIVVARIAVVKVVAPPDAAILVFHIRSGDPAAVNITVNDVVPLANEAVNASGFETQGPTRSVVTGGDLAVGALGFGLDLATGEELSFANNRPIIVEPGRMLTAHSTVGLGLVGIEMAWQETPRAAVAS